MGTAAFFPWLTIKAPIVVGKFGVIPYRRGVAPGPSGSAVQQDLDSVFGHYCDSNGAPISSAALLTFGKRSATHDLTSKEIREAFAFSELLAFSGLSAREFFGFSFAEYVSRDVYRLVVQRFSGHGGVGITTRRRDGNTNSFVSAAVYKIHKPEHVHRTLNLVLDLDLLKSLLNAWRISAEKDWEALYGAILAFNLANTDSDAISEALEIVLMSISVEQLLDATSKSEDIAQRFTETWRPSTSLRASIKPGIRKAQERRRFKDVHWLRGAWVRDFYALRGHLAHRSGVGYYPGVWKLKEHLLLGSLVVPLLAKIRLASRTHYVLTKDDRIRIEVFEKLCARNLFKKTKQGEEWPWRKIIGEAMLDDWWRTQAAAK